MKILSSDNYTKMKMDQYKRDPNMEEDEYGTPSKWVSIFGSPVGYFGLEEEVEDYHKIHEAIEKTIYGEIVAEASRLSTLAIAEFRKNNPTKKGAFVNEEFTYKGIPCHYSFDPFDGLNVDIHTQYVIDNYDKLDIDIPELNRVPFSKGFSATKGTKVFTEDVDSCSTSLHDAINSVVIQLRSKSESMLNHSLEELDNALVDFKSAVNRERSGKASTNFSKRLMKCFSVSEESRT